MKVQGICDGCRTPGDLQVPEGIPVGWTLVQVSGTTMGTTTKAYCMVCAPKISLPTPVTP